MVDRENAGRTAARMKKVFTEEELQRIVFKPGGIDCITGKKMLPSCSVDVHRMGKEKAERFVRNVIAIIQYPFRLTVVHGYNGGTEMLKMFRTRFEDTRINGYLSLLWNPGVTIFLVGEESLQIDRRKWKAA